MISTRRLVKMARKWQKNAILERRRISWQGADEKDVDAESSVCSSSGASVVSKGNFVVYSTDGKRFVVPLVHVNSKIFRELFRISEEEFGISPCNAPITMPGDGVFMEYIVSLLQQHVPADVERALLSFIVSGARYLLPYTHKNTPITSYLSLDFEEVYHTNQI